MGRNGVNWSRIWACNWDGKNPWWPTDDTPPSDQMWSKAFERWDQIVSAAEDAGISFQFVLFHHGAFSTRVNPNFPDHPWNKAKGGFLEKAADFFTDPEAKRRSKMWLRYAVARWGHSTSVMSLSRSADLSENVLQALRRLVKAFLLRLADGGLQNFHGTSPSNLGREGETDIRDSKLAALKGRDREHRFAIQGDRFHDFLNRNADRSTCAAL